MKFYAFALIAAFGPGIVAAQVCTPTAIPTTPLRNNTSSNDTTCGGFIGLNLGGTVYPHPSKVYEFVAQAANFAVTLTPASTDIEMSLVSSCTSAPIAIGFVGGPMVVPVGSLTNGQKYFVVVSKDPSLPPQPSPGLCGAYQFSVTGSSVPVSLQSFSVE